MDIKRLSDATLPHLKLLHAVDCFPGNGGLYEGRGAANAVERCVSHLTPGSQMIRPGWSTLFKRGHQGAREAYFLQLQINLCMLGFLMPQLAYLYVN